MLLEESSLALVHVVALRKKKHMFVVTRRWVGTTGMDDRHNVFKAEFAAVVHKFSDCARGAIPLFLTAVFFWTNPPLQVPAVWMVFQKFSDFWDVEHFPFDDGLEDSAD